MAPSILIRRIINYLDCSYDYKNYFLINKKFKFYFLSSKFYLNALLHHNCVINNISRIKSLISLGADPRAEDDVLIITASEYGHINIVRLLLSYHVDPLAHHGEAITSTSIGGYIDVIRLLISHGANPSIHHSYSLFLASKNSHYNLVRLLLSFNCNLLGQIVHIINRRKITYNINIFCLLQSYGN